jgi:hypothetical protein
MTAGRRGEDLRDRLRVAFIAGAEEEWRRRTGRPPTDEELRRLLRRWPGDPWDEGIKGVSSGSDNPGSYGRPVTIALLRGDRFDYAGIDVERTQRRRFDGSLSRLSRESRRSGYGPPSPSLV